MQSALVQGASRAVPTRGYTLRVGGQDALGLIVILSVTK